MNKTLIISVIVIISALLFMNQSKIEVKILPTGCNGSKTAFLNFAFDEVKIYNEKKESIDIEINEKHNELGSWNVFIPKEGIYYFEFVNIFGQNQDTTVMISAGNSILNLCIDKYEKSNESLFLTRLEEGKEPWILRIGSQGCFHSNNLEIRIYKTSGIYIVEYHRIGFDWDKKKLRLDQLEKLQDLEGKIRKMNNPDGGCTTTNEYTLSFKKYEIRIIDRSCSWEGPSQLLKILEIES